MGFRKGSLCPQYIQKLLIPRTISMSTQATRVPYSIDVPCDQEDVFCQLMDLRSDRVEPRGCGPLYLISAEA